MIRDFHPGSGFFTHLGSRIQELKRHRIIITNTRTVRIGIVFMCVVVC
jgi:hypothetical protein